MTRKKWPAEIHTVAHTLWRDGLTWPQITKQTGVPSATLRTWKCREAWQDADDAEPQTAEEILQTVRRSACLLSAHLQTQLASPTELRKLTVPELIQSLQRLLSALKDAADVLPLVDVAGFDVQMQALSEMLPELGLSEEQQASVAAVITQATAARLDAVDI